MATQEGVDDPRVTKEFVKSFEPLLASVAEAIEELRATELKVYGRDKFRAKTPAEREHSDRMQRIADELGEHATGAKDALRNEFDRYRLKQQGGLGG